MIAPPFHRNVEQLASTEVAELDALFKRTAQIAGDTKIAIPMQPPSLALASMHSSTPTPEEEHQEAKATHDMSNLSAAMENLTRKE